MELSKEAAPKEANKADNAIRSKSSANRSPSGVATMKKKNFSRTVVLRVVLIVTLLTAAALCAGFSYVSISNAEQGFGRQTYESIATGALDGARAIVLRKIQGSEVMAAWVSFAEPDSASWPLINVDGYIPIAEKVAQLSSSTTQSLMAFVDPAQAEEFEAHTQQVYVEQGRPEGAGVSDFGFGAYKNDASSPYEDGRLHDISGEVSLYESVDCY
jgi:hypothetical protein